MEHEFPLKEKIRGYLTTVTYDRIFPKIVDDINFHFNRPVTNLTDLKIRETKKRKGDIWEQFCRLWLLATAKYGLTHVYLYNELSPEILAYLGLKGKQDNGIDLIGFVGDASKPIAIQCKYRKQTNSLVTWKTLSTFVGLVTTTGAPVVDSSIPQQGKRTYYKTMVMTNCRGASRKVKLPTDVTIAFQTFCSTSVDAWMKMAGVYSPESLVSSSPKKEENHPTIEMLRELRLKKFSSSPIP